MTSTVRTISCLVAILLTESCIIVRSTRVEMLSPGQAIGTDVRTPLKAFHADGTITVFAGGARVTPDFVMGVGSHYSIDLASSARVERVPLDSIVGIEAFRGGVNAPATILASVGATTLVILGGVAIACAADPKCFGSCPTIYTYENGQEVLEAEAFSYSIAPLLEARDVDRLGARPDDDGVIRLEVRNEALETHYINHMEILEARHRAGRRAYPTEGGRAVSVGPVVAPVDARDRDGGNRIAELRDRDASVFSSTEDRIRNVTAEDYWDHIDLTFPKPSWSSAALVLRVRNSLLNSVLFYDLMLGSHGAEALEWLGTDIHRIGEAVELGRWFSETMGLRVSVLGPSGWEAVTRVGDTGPIAWKDLAVVVPVPDTEELHIRLTFLADEWRIDYAALAPDVERARVVSLPATSVSRIGSAPDETFRAKLSQPDEDYLVTSAGTAVSMTFQASAAPAGEEHTYFLSSQGYYTEWIRPDWIRNGTAEGFRPTPETVVELMERWLEEKEGFEARFYETRIPVR